MRYNRFINKIVIIFLTVFITGAVIWYFSQKSKPVNIITGLNKSEVVAQKSPSPSSTHAFLSTPEVKEISTTKPSPVTKQIRALTVNDNFESGSLSKNWTNFCCGGDVILTQGNLGKIKNGMSGFFGTQVVLTQTSFLKLLFPRLFRMG